MSEDNLISFDKRTEKEQREIAKQGGIASGEARRAKRDLRKALEVLLEKTVTKDKEGNEISGAEAIALKQFEKALKGDTKAFEVVRDTSGQSVVQKVALAEVDADIIAEVENIVLNDEKTSD